MFSIQHFYRLFKIKKITEGPMPIYIQRKIHSWFYFHSARHIFVRYNIITRNLADLIHKYYHKLFSPPFYFLILWAVRTGKPKNESHKQNNCSAQICTVPQMPVGQQEKCKVSYVLNKHTNKIWIFYSFSGVKFNHIILARSSNTIPAVNCCLAVFYGSLIHIWRSICFRYDGA